MMSPKDHFILSLTAKEQMYMPLLCYSRNSQNHIRIIFQQIHTEMSLTEPFTYILFYQKKNTYHTRNLTKYTAFLDII